MKDYKTVSIEEQKEYGCIAPYKIKGDLTIPKGDSKNLNFRVDGDPEELSDFLGGWMDYKFGHEGLDYSNGPKKDGLEKNLEQSSRNRILEPCDENLTHEQRLVGFANSLKYAPTYQETKPEEKLFYDTRNLIRTYLKENYGNFFKEDEKIFFPDLKKESDYFSKLDAVVRAYVVNVFELDEVKEKLSDYFTKPEGSDHKLSEILNKETIDRDYKPLVKI